MKNLSHLPLRMGAIAVGLALCLPQSPASAQAAYGSYVGVGASFGLTRAENDDRKVSGVIAGRYKFLRAPISLRGQVLIGDGVALVPTVSYDIPLNWQADVYIGAGASIPIDSNTPIGNQTSFALQPGIDYALPNSDLVLFGNAIIAFDGYKRGGAATSLQGGVGIRF
ncbi:MAG: porin family protein [Leptolyngbyaceae cyanobacterium CSU_1_3]|nr:porin family protein [Leptolyngbyaceae cyanobacterium CSU_1_3]